MNEEASRSATFATTHWSVVIRAGELDHEAAKTALTHLCQRYWYPLYYFVRRKGLGAEEAQDLTQAFFADFLARNQVSHADPARGRFRSFVVASLENFLHNEWRRRTALKRGGGVLPLSLDAERAEARFAAEPLDTESPDIACARQWARTLLQQTGETLEAEWRRDGRLELFQALQQHLWGDSDSVPYADLCRRHDLTPVNLRVTFHRLRQRYRELLRQAVAETVAEPDEIDDELRFLMQVVSR
ncbi:MAG: sigma-70 family RNA polymerase sigma factor [Verrucomicrobiales bacterium]|nr:sigma-70 family RNA polymerase sigma factor [Verrucomicrobiales bacterium]MCP5525827.1 sigma-70 family RNA polymerase sigma factor [Verrucomicrobiales bacterium]